MPNDNVIGLSEPTPTCTVAQALAFIERTRRQVERFESLRERRASGLRRKTPPRFPAGNATISKAGHQVSRT